MSKALLGFAGQREEESNILAGATGFEMGYTTPEQSKAIATQPTQQYYKPISAEHEARILPGESGGDFGALYGQAQRPGGQFAGVDLQNMTINEAIEFADPNGPYGQWVAANNGGTVSTPMGGFQIVGKTMKMARDGIGLSGNEKLTPGMQRELAGYIMDVQGPGAWEAYNHGDVTKSSGSYSPGSSPSLGLGSGPQLPEDYYEDDPEKNRRHQQAMLLQGLGVGLGQMSHGKPVDLSSVLNQIGDRKKEARRRRMELYREQRNQFNRAEDRAYAVSDREDTQAHAAAMRQMDQTFQTGLQDRGHLQAIERGGITHGQSLETMEAGNEFTRERDATLDGYRKEGVLSDQAFTKSQKLLDREQQSSLAYMNQDFQAHMQQVGIDANKDLAATERGYDISDEEKAEAAVMEAFGDTVPNADILYRAGGIKAVNDAATNAMATQNRTNTVDQLTELGENINDPALQSVATLMGANPDLDMETAFEMVTKDDRTAGQKEFAAYQEMTPTEQETYRAFKQSGATKIDFGNTKEVEIFKYGVGQLSQDAEALAAKQPGLQAYQQLAQLMSLDGGNIPTGTIEGWSLGPRKVLRDLGLLDADENLIVNAQEAMSQLGTRLISTVRIPGTGATSDLEFNAFMASVPDVDKGWLVNRMQTQTALRYGKIETLKLEAKEKFLMDNGSLHGFDRHFEGLQDSGEVPAYLYDTSMDQNAFSSSVTNGHIKVGDIIIHDGRPIELTQEHIDKVGGAGQ